MEKPLCFGGFIFTEKEVKEAGCLECPFFHECKVASYSIDRACFTNWPNPTHPGGCLNCQVDVAEECIKLTPRPNVLTTEDFIAFNMARYKK